MKRKIFVLIIFVTFIAYSSYSQAVVTLHSNGAIQHFSGINALVNAYASSSSGDTVYLPGGSFIPPTSFDKGLIIYGAGHYPDSTLATGKTFINGTVTLNGNADNFHLEGVEVTESIVFSNNEAVNQVTIKYCKINGAFDVQGNLSNPSNNVALIENVFLGDITLSNATNVAMYNCIAQSHVINSVGNIFFNDIFLFRGSFGNYVLPSQCVNNIFSNNIFLQTDWNMVTYGSGNNFKNNLFLLASPELGIAYISQNNYFGVAQSSIFINQTGNVFDYTHNYHLQSPSAYLGTDAMSIGIFGGVFSYKEGAVPSNPHIREKTVSQTTDAQGKINVNIKVAAQER